MHLWVIFHLRPAGRRRGGAAAGRRTDGGADSSALVHWHHRATEPQCAVVAPVHLQTMSQLYMQVAEVIEKWLAKKGGLKTLAFAKTVRQNAAVYSLSAETLKYKPTLEALLQSAGAATAAHRLDVRPALLLVMSYDLLFGHGKIDGGGKVKRLLSEHEAKLRTELARLKGKVGARSDCELLPAALRAQTAFPRFVRVNTLLTSVPEVVAAFVTDGYSFSAELLAPGQFPMYACSFISNYIKFLELPVCISCLCGGSNIAACVYQTTLSSFFLVLQRQTIPPRRAPAVPACVFTRS